MNSIDSHNFKKYRKRLDPVKTSFNMSKNYFYSEVKKEENSSSSILNSLKYLTTFDESSFDSKKLHFIKNPYKMWIPIKLKMKKIRNKRLLSLNTYYRRTIKNNLILKDILTSDSLNVKINNSKDEFQKTPKKNGVLKTNNKFSKSNKSNISKKVAFMGTERTISTKELTNLNSLNNSKINYGKYNIFSYNSNKNLDENYSNNISLFKKINNSNSIDNYKSYRFLSMNEGFQNLPSIKNGVNYFSYEIKNLIKERFINHCLKQKETKIKEYKECSDDNYRIEMKQKMDNRNLFDIFHKDYLTYYNKLQIKMLKDNDYISVLKWNIISYKNEVNRLNIRKDKLLARLNRYIKMKHFLIQMTNYSLDKIDDSWISKKSTTIIVNPNDKNDLIKENRRIKDESSDEVDKHLRKRGSVQIENISLLNEFLVNPEKNKLKRKQKKTLSSREKNPLLGSGIKDVTTILNNHIANLLIYQNQLRIDLEPLREEYKNLYNSLKQSEKRQNELLKLQFLVLPEKKRILKERNEFLKKSLFNINNSLFNISKYNKMNELIEKKLIIIYKILVDNKIISFIKMKTSIEENIFEKLLFYLKNIEKGLVILNENKDKLKNNYPIIYEIVEKEINDDMKRKTVLAQRQMRLNMTNKKANEIANKMQKGLILNKHKDYYEYGYKKPKVKKKYKKINPYDELRYSDSEDDDDNEISVVDNKEKKEK